MGLKSGAKKNFRPDFIGLEFSFVRVSFPLSDRVAIVRVLIKDLIVWI